MKKILIIDDSAFTRNIHKQIIESGGYEVMEATNGNDGIEAFKKEKPDLVITDLLMPDMDGMDVVAKIHEIDPDAKTIVCSVDRQKSRLEDAKKVGALDFLIKPVNAKKMIEALNNILG